MYYQTNYNIKKKTPSSDASLTVATGDASSSERTFLFPKTVEIHSDDGRGSMRIGKWAAIVFIVVLILHVACWGRNGVEKESNETSISKHDSDSNLQWWEEASSIPTTQKSLPAPSMWQAHVSGDKQFSHELRWGILGAGRIARDFTTALRMAGSHVQAVAAASLPHGHARAEAFASNYEIPHYYGSYGELAADPTVDIVYVATTNQLHYGNVIQMLEAGKNVLVEKPMTLTLHEAEEMAAAAKKNTRFLMTNFWTRFFPVYSNYTRRMIHDEALANGEMAMRGDIAFTARPNHVSSDRLLKRNLGGGALLDLGCYLVNVAVMMADSLFQQHGHRQDVASYLHSVDIQATGTNIYQGKKYSVDTEVSFALQWKEDSYSPDTNSNLRVLQQADDDLSFLMSGQVSFRRPSSFEIELTGHGGRLKIHRPANAPHAATFYQHEDRYGPVTKMEHTESPLIPFNSAFGKEEYPGATGFLYVISAIEECMNTKGIPGRATKDGCLGLETLPMEHQVLTVEITEEIMKKVGYWDDFENYSI
eukprot:scaffold3134_cov182-Amphora_coffeaeformis.AAC.6